jgi:hypothetical protein
VNVELVSIVALAGWLVLALSAYRSYQISGRKTLMYVLVWTSIFLAVALVFAAVGG